MNRKTFLVYLCLLPLFSCGHSDLRSEIQHQELINEFVEICWNQKELSIIDSICSEDYSRYVNNVKLASNRKELAANMKMYFKGFPDFELSINSSFNNANQTLLDWTVTGTNTGIFGEVQATGKKVKISGFTRIKFNENGKISSEQIYFNELELLQQLGYTLEPPIVN